MRLVTVFVSLGLLGASCGPPDNEARPEQNEETAATTGAATVEAAPTSGLEYFTLTCPDGTEVVGLGSLYEDEDEVFVDKCIPKTTTTTRTTTTTAVYSSFSNPVPRGGSVIYDFTDNIAGDQKWEIALSSSVTDVTDAYSAICGSRCDDELVNDLTRWVRVSVTFSNLGSQPVEVAGTFQFIQLAGADAVTRDFTTCETVPSAFTDYYVTLLPTGTTQSEFCGPISDNDANGDLLILVSGIGHNPLYFEATNQI